jgi:hypothetical protein
MHTVTREVVSVFCAHFTVHTVSFVREEERELWMQFVSGDVGAFIKHYR